MRSGRLLARLHQNRARHVRRGFCCLTGVRLFSFRVLGDAFERTGLCLCVGPTPVRGIGHYWTHNDVGVPNVGVFIVWNHDWRRRWSRRRRGLPKLWQRSPLRF